jgi:ABC-2 type transport system permease protein
MRGGRVLWAIDQVSAELDSLRGHGGEQLAFNKQLNLDDQLFRYGVRINYDLIADMNCSPYPLLRAMPAGRRRSNAAMAVLPGLPAHIQAPYCEKPGWYYQSVCQYY